MLIAKQEPAKRTYYGDQGHRAYTDRWYGGCNIYLQYNQDWDSNCAGKKNLVMFQSKSC